MTNRASGAGRAAPQSDRLWPYGTLTALLVTPIALVVFGALLAVLRAHSKWPDPRSDSFVLGVLVLVSLVPAFLLGLDFIASRGGAITVRDVSIDFSAVQRSDQVQLKSNF